MPVTRISDLAIVPSIFAQGYTLESLEKDLLIQSGAVTRDAEIDNFLSNTMGGTNFTVRRHGPLNADDEHNISTDDPTQFAEAKKISALQTVAVRQSINQTWSEMDLAVDLYGVDPLGDLTSQIGKYWLSRRSRILLASIQGLLADSEANHDGDMVVNISEATTAPTAANLINGSAIIDAAASMGDRAQDLTGIAVHSTVMATMQKLNMIETQQLSDTNIYFPTFMGFPIINDDGLTVVNVPAVSGGSPKPAYKQYFSYVFGPGAFALGFGQPKTPFAIKRDELAGNGGGQETYISRIEMILHPRGYTCNLTSTPSMAQLQTASTWTRVYDRKRIPLAVIKSNG